MEWKRLVDSIEYYKSNGFKWIDLNWTVPTNISAITRPHDKKDFYINDKVLVASGEQAFIELLFDSKISGRYVGMTPCFRDDELSAIHQQYFMKVELIDTENVTQKSLIEITNICLNFFNQYVKCKVIRTPEGFDIVTDPGIELGSYGIRYNDRGSWIYATGLAEPRLEILIKNQK